MTKVSDERVAKWQRWLDAGAPFNHPLVLKKLLADRRAAKEREAELRKEVERLQSNSEGYCKELLARLLGWKMFPYVVPGLPGGDQQWCPPGTEVHISNAVPLPSVKQLFEQAETAVRESRAKLKQQRIDDGEPPTAEWLGWTGPEKCPFIFSPKSAADDGVSLSFDPSNGNVSLEIEGMDGASLSYELPATRTRDDLRRLCAALGVPLGAGKHG